MGKEYRFAAPESMQLHRMSAKEIEQTVRRHATEALERMPDGIRPSGVNRVVLDATSTRRPGSGDWGGWAEWTRACCGSRTLIDDFDDPVISEIELAGSPVAARLSAAHFESQLRLVELEDPATHVAADKAGR